MISTTEGGPSIVEGDIDLFERESGLILPSDYRSFLLAWNGGRPSRDLFRVPGCAANPVARLHFFFGIGDPVEACDLQWNLHVYFDRIPDGLLPIATTEGADKICMAVRGEARGQIVYWDGYQHGATKLFHVANGFSEFIEELFADENPPKLPTA